MSMGPALLDPPDRPRFARLCHGPGGVRHAARPQVWSEPDRSPVEPAAQPALARARRSASTAAGGTIPETSPPNAAISLTRLELT
jgi:hypothetical protein